MSDTTLQALAEILHSATRLWKRSSDSDEVEVLPRERFHYWCFDLLFIVTSRHAIVDDPASARRTAGFFLPFLVARCKMALIEFLEDLPLRGAMPFERVREDEVVYVLQRLLDLEVWEDGLKAVTQWEGNAAATPLKQAILASPRAHLFHLYPILLDIATYNGLGALPKVWISKRDGPTGGDRESREPADATQEHMGEHEAETSSTGDNAADDAVEVDAREVAKACLKALTKDIGF
ncbi:hypothetical protein QFC20_006328 [Naganishia adeliensis]|nr:hypothetical protein QFC20_006328 [Naganishia adeliensis]